MKRQMMLGAALGALMVAAAPAGAQTLVQDAASVPGQVVGGTVGAAGTVAGAAVGTAGAVAGTALAAPGAVAGGLFGLGEAGAMSLRDFRAEALRSDAYEIESGRLALQRSRDPRIRAHARQMVRDHQMTTAALLPEGTSLNATGNVVADRTDGQDAFGSFGEILTAPLTIPVEIVGRTLEGRELIDNEPATPGRRVAIDPRRQAMLDTLAQSRGRSFNANYARQQVQAHQEAVALYAGYAREGQDDNGRTFAQQILPRLQMHLSASQEIDDRYANSEPAF